MPSPNANKKTKILVAGAGPAGTSAAIRLAQNGLQVTLVEREKFPREKLCGEFISPECFAHFRDLGVLDGMFAAGGEPLAETFFYAANGKSVGVPSKWFHQTANALGLSRAEMDFRLLEQAKKIGVEVLEEISVVNLLFENKKVCGVKAKNRDQNFFEINGDLIVDATGRHAVLSKLAEKQSRVANDELRNAKIQNPKSKTENRLVGFKAHLKNASVERGRCEIYFFSGGYGGLNFIENDLSNHCFLMRAEAVREFGGDAERIVREIICRNKRAAQTLKNAEAVTDWLAVTVDEFGLKTLSSAPNLLAVGDAGAFIDPFTGSGMLMALESGEILSRSIVESSSFEQISDVYQKLHREKFQKRLRVCAFVRRAAFAPNLASVLISALNFGSLPRKILAKATRTPVFGSK